MSLCYDSTVSSSIDKVLVGLLASWASIAVHGALFVGFTSASDELVEDIAIELTFVDPSAVDTGEDEAIAPSLVVDDAAIAHVPKTVEERTQGAAPSASLATPTPRGFRARLRALEEAHARREAQAARGLAAVRRAVGPASSTTNAPVARCRDRDGFAPIDRLPVRHLARLSSVLPKGVLPLAYIEQTGELSRRRLGDGWRVDLALPASLAAIPLDEPRDHVVVLGRDDARCAISVEVTRQLFPLVMRGLPVRVVVEDRVVASAVVDVRVTADARIEVLRAEGDAIPFERGALARREKVADTLRAHASSFSAIVALAELLGDE